MGFFFKISLSDSLSLVHRNATDFCILILYSATLSNSLVNSSSFLVASLGFSMYSIMLSANSDSFISSFPVWIPFISFCLGIYNGKKTVSSIGDAGKTGQVQVKE